MRLKQSFVVFLALLIAATVLGGCASGAGERDGGGHDIDGERTGVGMPPPPSASRAMVDALDEWEDTARGIDLYSRAIEIDPAHALAYYKRAELHRHSGDPQQALLDYDRAIEIEPGFLQARVERGFLRLWELGDEAGSEDIAIAYSIDPNDLRTALAFADLLEWREPDRAVEILDRLTREYPDHPDPFLHRAKLRRNQGEYEASAADFEAAIRRGMDESWVVGERAMVLVAIGRVDEARRIVGVAAQGDPGNPELALSRARLAVLRGTPEEASALYSQYLDSEWVHQPVKLEAAFIAAAGGERELAGALIRSFREMEDDPLRGDLAEIGALALAGESAVAARRLAAMLGEADWYAPAWLMLAALAIADREAVPEQAAAELGRRFEEIQPEFRSLFFDHTESVIWLRLYAGLHPEAGERLTLP